MDRPWPAALAHARRRCNAVLRSKFVAGLTTPHDVDDYLECIDRTWSVRDVRARVEEIRRETSNAISVLVRPNENWRGFRAGQFVEVSVRTNGVRHTRCFSLSSAPEDGLPMRLTIQEIPGGKLSGWATGPGCLGDVVGLSPAKGSFVLPEPVPPKLLFVSGGSGITPLMSMLRHLIATGYAGNVVFVHYARRDVIFAEELAAISRRWVGIRTSVTLTRRPDDSHAPRSRFSRPALEAIAPDWTDRETFLCGPNALIDAVTEVWSARGLAERLHVERFAAPARTLSGFGHAQYRLLFARSGREMIGRDGVSLLEQAEAAGLRPAFGCRMGICHTCTRRKLSGTVRNTLTGAVTSEPDEAIQLCVTTPYSDVTLDL
jgi:stearoyl-CoA 9-desaturase NADPH oxidoreductase